MRVFTATLLLSLLPALSFAGNIDLSGGGENCGARVTQRTALQDYICRTNPSQCENVHLATINGTDDRFTQEENSLEFLTEAFNSIGELVSDDGQCPIQGSGFINNGKLTTARHVICDMVSRNCDISKLKLRNREQGWSHELESISSEGVSCSEKNDVLILNFKNRLATQGIETATAREGAQIIRSGASSCHVVGVHVDTMKLQASSVRHLIPGRVNGTPAFSHCADTYPGSSGGALVCNVNGAPKALGINSHSASAANQDNKVTSCNLENIATNGTMATYLAPTQDI